MDISVYVASAFSKNNIGGNKAGVVLNEPTLTNTQKNGYRKTTRLCGNRLPN